MKLALASHDRRDKCWQGGRLEAGDRPDKSTECPNRAAMPPRRGHGDVSYAQEGDWRMIVRKAKVEIGNSGLSLEKTYTVSRDTNAH